MLGHASRGPLYVFVKPAGGWVNGTQTAKLTASDGAAGDLLGGPSRSPVTRSSPGPAQTSRAMSPGCRLCLRRARRRLGDRDQTAKLTASDGAQVTSSAVGRHHGRHDRRRRVRRRLAPSPRRRRLRLRQAGRRLGERHGDGEADALGRPGKGQLRRLGRPRGRHHRRRRPILTCPATGAGAAYVFSQAPATITVTKTSLRRPTPAASTSRSREPW